MGQVCPNLPEVNIVSTAEPYGLVKPWQPMSQRSIGLCFARQREPLENDSLAVLVFLQGMSANEHVERSQGD
jgi:hypothetical protein